MIEAWFAPRRSAGWARPILGPTRTPFDGGHIQAVVPMRVGAVAHSA